MPQHRFITSKAALFDSMHELPSQLFAESEGHTRVIFYLPSRRVFATLRRGWQLLGKAAVCTCTKMSKRISLGLSIVQPITHGQPVSSDSNFCRGRLTNTSLISLKRPSKKQGIVRYGRWRLLARHWAWRLFPLIYSLCQPAHFCMNGGSAKLPIRKHPKWRRPNRTSNSRFWIGKTGFCSSFLVTIFPHRLVS